MLRSSSLSAPAFLLCALGSLAAQIPYGPGASNGVFPGNTHTLDVQSLASAALGYAVNGVLGVARTPDGHFWVSARNDTLIAGGFHQLIELDSTGVVLGTYSQPTSFAAGTNEWGVRDLAWDGDTNPATSRLFAGQEYAVTGDRIWAWDWTNKVWDSARDVVLQAGAATNGTARALAVIPPGNAAFPGATQGVIVTTSFDGAIDWIDIATGAAAQASTPSVQLGTFGAAYDPDGDTVWFAGQDGSPRSSTTRVNFTQTDVAGGTTGQQFIGDLRLPGVYPGGVVGGCEFYFDPGTGRPTIIYVAQATSDTLVAVGGRLEYAPGCLGDLTLGGGPAWAGNANFQLVVNDIPAGVPNVFIWFGFPNDPGFNFGGTLLSCNIMLTAGFWADPIGSAPVTGGTAVFPFPLPNIPIAYDAQFAVQFMVPAAGTITPIGMSEAGRVYVNR